MIDMTKDEQYIEIHESLVKIRNRINDYKANYRLLKDEELMRLKGLEIRLKHYEKRFEYVESWFGILL